MNVNKILPFLLLLPFLASCTSKYKIEGTSSVNSLDGKMLYLKSLLDGEWVKLDSAEVVHGLFSMKGKIDSVQMVTLYMDEESIMPIVLESGKITVTISNTDLKAVGVYQQKKPIRRKYQRTGAERNPYGIGWRGSG